MSASDRRHVELVITAADEATEFFLFDGWSRLDRGRGQLTRTVPAGIYRVRARTGYATEERDLVLDGKEKPKPLRFGLLRYATPAPLVETAYYTPGLGALVRKASQVRGPAGLASLFLFSRTLGRDPAEPSPAVARALIGSMLMTLDEAPGRGFDGRAVAPSRESGVDLWWALQRREPAPLIRRGIAPDGHIVERMLLPVADRQLQVFQSAAPVKGMPGSTTALCTADPAEEAIFYGDPGAGFDPASAETRVEDLARLALAHDRLPLSGAVLRGVLSGQFKSPMLGLYVGHLYLRFRDQVNYPDGLGAVVKRLGELLGLGHPDVAALALAAGRLPQDYRFHVPPMLAASWQLVLDASARRPELIPSDSYAARIAGRVRGGGPWLTWEYTGAVDGGGWDPPLRDWFASRHAVRGRTESSLPPPDLVRPDVAAGVDPTDAALVEVLRQGEVQPTDVAAYLGGAEPAADAPAQKVGAVMPRLVRSSGLPRSLVEDRLKRLLPNPEAGDTEFDPAAKAAEKILWYTPREAWDTLWQVTQVPGLDLQAHVQGGGEIDPANPTDIYATYLADGETAEWGWTTFRATEGSVSLIDVATGEDLAPGHDNRKAASFDAVAGVVRVNAERLPEAEWRLFALGPGEPLSGTLYRQRAVFAVCRRRPPPVPVGDAAGLVLAGHLIAAWRAALNRRRAWTNRALSWLVGTLFARMQLLLDEVIEDKPPVADACGFLLDDLGKTRRRRVDSLKQGLWDHFQL